MRVIRTGCKPQPDYSQQDLDCLQGYWSWEEQMGLRKKPEESKVSIPDIVLAAPQIGRYKG